jgi:hypothetical protein
MPGEDMPSLDSSEFLEALSKFGFRAKEAQDCMNYMDPDADGDVDFDEFTRRISEMNDPSAMDEFNIKVGEAMERLGAHIDRNHMHITDFFKKMDEDGSGEIEVRYLLFPFSLLSRSHHTTPYTF